ARRHWSTPPTPLLRRSRTRSPPMSMTPSTRQATRYERRQAAQEGGSPRLTAHKRREQTAARRSISCWRRPVENPNDSRPRRIDLRSPGPHAACQIGVDDTPTPYALVSEKALTILAIYPVRLDFDVFTFTHGAFFLGVAYGSDVDNRQRGHPPNPVYHS